MVSTAIDRRPLASRGRASRLDLVLVLSTLLVAGIGVVMVYSATRDKLRLAGYNPHYYLERQAEFVVLGIVVMFVLAAVDYRWLEQGAALLYGLILLALLAMFAVGHSSLGATRWISLGPLQFQPSSFAAIVLIVIVAAYAARHPDGIDRRELLGLLGLCAIPIVLVAKQPDLGSAIVMAVVLLVMLVIAGIANRDLAVLVVLAALGAVAMVHFGLLKHYQVTRITSFLNQGKGSNGAAIYNLNQSEAAIGDGGLFGTGLFHGAQTNLSYVPEQQTDFIFSAVGEQLGFVGSATILALLGVIAWRCVRIAQRSRDLFGRIAATGAFALLAFSTIENAGMTMGIMPIAGIPLPFLSYGGSATIAFFAAVGIALSVRRHQLA
jgi:rod shape determining protein RodA